MTDHIGVAFNDAFKINKSWLILALPFIIYYIFDVLFKDSKILVLLISIILFIFELGVLTKIIEHILTGNNGLIHVDFSLYNVDLIVNGIKSLIKVLIVIILFVAIYLSFLAIGFSTGNATGLIIILLALLIMMILLNLFGFSLAHGNTDSYVNGIIELPRILKYVGIGNFIIFLIVNLILLVVVGLLVSFVSIIPIIGSILLAAILSTAFSFYFILASTYMYRECVLKNKDKFNPNEHNIILRYPAKANENVRQIDDL